MKFTHFPFIVILIVALALTSCTQTEGDTPTISHNDSAAARVLSGAARASSTPATSLNLEPLREAFENLQTYGFTRIVQTEQLNESGDVVANEKRMISYQMRDGEWTIAARPLASTGSFDFGFFGRFAPGGESNADLRSVTSALVPEDPPYLSARYRDAFTYTPASDTVIGDIRVATLVIEALPDTEEQPTKYARLYYDPRTNDVLALYTEHENPALLFQENTSLYVQIRPSFDGGWLPDSTSVSTQIRLPLTATRRFRTTARFVDYSPAEQ